MKKMIFALLVVGLMFASVSAHAEEEVLFGFENGLEGWDVPDWAYEKPDHVQREINLSDAVAREGTHSLEVMAEFPGNSWSGAIVEVAQYFDWSDYSKIACDVYLPADAPKGLKVKMILTVGDTWKWVEMSREFALVPGKWVTVKADLMPGSIDWKRVQVDPGFRQDIRKLDIRVVSNGQPAYSGPFYIDNVRVIE
ncbi:MAG: hypothetical protein KJ995_06065 [Candidatus Omnitrophica bacterium]|nr:hypothetical protein [Candidatus Omnitrophota bacterium]MBU1127630.1 hypothetical protein [Candidatus Omnitrophota bacterium]MBU1656885.1 hypothetical protein [Candidatus Omnitrophota bacterium]MBU1784950.1 hypothetical protein [Candidatus Omnitrophota bacterium]MBU1851952.1 hypothetical protein [Candidatus Omnitrophota bacterium]